MGDLTGEQDQIKALNDDPVEYAVAIFKNVITIVNEESKKQTDPDKILDIVQRKYLVFTRQYPLIVRMMVMNGQFNRRAFEKYIKYLNAHGPKSKEDMIYNRALWLRFYHRETSAHISGKECAIIVESAYKTLKKEDEEMMAIIKKSEADIKKEEEEVLGKQKDEIIDYIQSYKKFIDHRKSQM